MNHERPIGRPLPFSKPRTLGHAQRPRGPHPDPLLAAPTPLPLWTSTGTRSDVGGPGDRLCRSLPARATFRTGKVNPV